MSLLILTQKPNQSSHSMLLAKNFASSLREVRCIFKRSFASRLNREKDSHSGF